MKILVFDLETTGFKADFSHLLTAAAKFVGEEEVYYWRIDHHPDYGKTPASMMNDKWIVEGVIELIEESDMLVGHYLDRFDVPFLNTRALDWGLMPAPQIRTVDTWKIARQNLALGRNSLANVADFLNDETAQKGGLSKTQWKLAAHGDKKVLDAMVEYNIGDVIATEEAYLKLRPVMKNHPYVSAPVNGEDRTHQCNACGSMNTVSKGSYYTKLYHVARRRCKDCGTPFEEGRSRIS